MSYLAHQPTDRSGDYTISVITNRIERTDTAIALYLQNYPEASVDDALDALFKLGVDSFIARCESGFVPNGVPL